MSMEVTIHRLARAEFHNFDSFCILRFNGCNGEEISLFLDRDMRQAAEQMAEYFNDNIATPPAPAEPPHDPDFYEVF